MERQKQLIQLLFVSVGGKDSKQSNVKKVIVIFKNMDKLDEDKKDMFKSVMLTQGGNIKQDVASAFRQENEQPTLKQIQEMFKKADIEEAKAEDELLKKRKISRGVLRLDQLRQKNKQQAFTAIKRADQQIEEMKEEIEERKGDAEEQRVQQQQEANFSFNNHLQRPDQNGGQRAVDFINDPVIQEIRGEELAAGDYENLLMDHLSDISSNFHRLNAEDDGFSFDFHRHQDEVDDIVQSINEHNFEIDQDMRGDDSVDRSLQNILNQLEREGLINQSLPIDSEIVERMDQAIQTEKKIVQKIKDTFVPKERRLGDLVRNKQDNKKRINRFKVGAKSSFQLRGIC